jgi:predicted DNA-binding transcriptional regulator AlpA
MTKEKLQDTLAYPPRGMNCDRAAAYCGVSRTTFSELVASEVLPPAKNLGGLARWDRIDLDAAWDALDDAARRKPRSSDKRSFDEMLKNSSNAIVVRPGHSIGE